MISPGPETAKRFYRDRGKWNFFTGTGTSKTILPGSGPAKRFYWDHDQKKVILPIPEWNLNNRQLIDILFEYRIDYITIINKHYWYCWYLSSIWQKKNSG
jgi:hypothetical protein